MRKFREILEASLTPRGDGWLYDLTTATRSISKSKYKGMFFVIRDKQETDTDKHMGMRWDIVDNAVVDNVNVFAIDDLIHYDDRTPQINVQWALADIGAGKFKPKGH